MAEILRMRVELDWDQGAPGVNTFHISAGVPSPLDWTNTLDQAVVEIGDLYRSLDGLMNPIVDWLVSPIADVINVETGNIVDQISSGAAVQAGGGTGSGQNMPRSQQIYFRYLTDLFQNGRRLAGGIYLGPIGTSEIGNNGQLTPAQATAYEGYFAALTSGVGPRLAVYHRPATAAGADGYYADVMRVRCKRSPAILSSRRD